MRGRHDAEVLARPKFALPSDEIEPLTAMLRSQGEEVPNPRPFFVIYQIRRTRNF